MPGGAGRRLQARLTRVQIAGGEFVVLLGGRAQKLKDRAARAFAVERIFGLRLGRRSLPAGLGRGLPPGEAACYQQSDRQQDQPAQLHRLIMPECQTARKMAACPNCCASSLPGFGNLDDRLAG